MIILCSGRACKSEETKVSEIQMAANANVTQGHDWCVKKVLGEYQNATVSLMDMVWDVYGYSL